MRMLGPWASICLLLHSVALRTSNLRIMPNLFTTLLMVHSPGFWDRIDLAGGSFSFGRMQDPFSKTLIFEIARN